jgi:RNA polymerase sigma factor (TIGR02999 family)
MNDVTRILNALADDDRKAAHELVPLVYNELRRLAAIQLAREKPGQTLQATALVHEAYLHLVGNDPERPWNNRGHFYAAAAEAMRRILIDRWRQKQTRRHGGGLQRVPLPEDVLVDEPCQDLLALDKALSRLAEKHPIHAELVKLRFFAGLTMPEAAQALGIGLKTAERYWRFARTWLYAELEDEDKPAGKGKKANSE